jgi:hypothetical protein
MTVITIQLLGLEGVVSKKLSAPRSGPSKAWLKIKNPKHPPQSRYRWDALNAATLLGIDLVIAVPPRQTICS